MHLGINFFWILGSLSTFRLFHSYESKKVSGRFPDVLIRVASRIVERRVKSYAAQSISVRVYLEVTAES